MSDTPTAGTPDPVSDTPAATGGPRLTLGQAVRTTGLSRSTLQRRLRDDSIPGATRTPGGGWSIPVAGLIAAGIAPRHSPPDTPPASRVAEVTADPASVPGGTPDTAEVERLRAELDRTRTDLEVTRARVAEVTADRETLRAALEALSRALPPGPVLTTPPAPAARRRWWGKPG